MCALPAYSQVILPPPGYFISPTTPLQASLTPSTVTNLTNEPFLFSETGTLTDQDLYYIPSTGIREELNESPTLLAPLLTQPHCESGVIEHANGEYKGNTSITIAQIEALSNLAPGTHLFKDTWTFVDLSGQPNTQDQPATPEVVIVELGKPKS